MAVKKEGVEWLKILNGLGTFGKALERIFRVESSMQFIRVQVAASICFYFSVQLSICHESDETNVLDYITVVVNRV